jgi:hypothetical protein
MIRRAKYVHFFLIGLLASACANHSEEELVDCATSGLTLAVDNRGNPSGCGVENGSITVSATGGRTPYQFSLDGSTFQANGAFSQLLGGSYTVTLKDANGCETTTDVTLQVPSSDLAATVETSMVTGCGAPNGSITVTATGTKTPFQYKLGTGAFGNNPEFENLASGQYSVTVRDADNCSQVVSATVARGASGVTYSGDIKNIISTNCAISGCHVAGGQSPNFSEFSNVKANAAAIKNRTGSRSMPPDGQPDLSQSAINEIACWVDDGAKDN